MSSSSSSDTDAEEEARNEALGLGGAKLKAVLSEIDKNGLGVAGGSGIAVKGGEVLVIIYERRQNMSGDPTAHALYSTLLCAAGAPYVAMLRVWTSTGRLVDPYEELCVKESKFINRGILEMDYTDEYWERRYTVRSEQYLSRGSRLNLKVSCVMVLLCLRLRNATKLASRCQDQWVADYLAAHVYHHCWKGGNTRFFWPENT
jgi:gamma-tubulin complex component 2